MLPLVITIFALGAFFSSVAIVFLTAKWFKASKARFATAVIVTLLTLIVGLPAAMLQNTLRLVVGLVSLGASIIIFKRFFSVGWGKAAGIWAVSSLISGAVSVIVVLFLHNVVFQPFRVVGSAMAPTVNQGDYLITTRIDQTIQGSNYVPGRGQIIVFKYPNDPKIVLIKRVVALPGERLVIKSGKVTVYNQTNPAGFDPDMADGLAGADTLGDIDITMPVGSVYVIGDNRNPNGSFDSREWGPLPISDIIATVKYRLEPTFNSY